MFLARFSPWVGESQWHHWLLGRVAVLEILKERASEGILCSLGIVGEEFAVALDDESAQATFEIGLGLPGDFVAADTHVRRRRRWRAVGHGGVLDVLHPERCDRLAR